MEAVKAVLPATRLPRLDCPDSPLLEELRESRILPETGERGVDAQEVRLVVAELERFGEPRERVVVVAVERVEAGGGVRPPRLSPARLRPPPRARAPAPARPRAPPIKRPQTARAPGAVLPALAHAPSGPASWRRGQGSGSPRAVGSSCKRGPTTGSSTSLARGG